MEVHSPVMSTRPQVSRPRPQTQSHNHMLLQHQHWQCQATEAAIYANRDVYIINRACEIDLRNLFQTLHLVAETCYSVLSLT